MATAVAEEKNITVNRRARHEYFVEDSYEAGIALVGTEVKSLRAGRVNLMDAYAKVVNGEVWLYSAHISAWEKASRFNHDPVRPRKLLLHRREIAVLAEETQQKGLALIPLRMYWSKGRAKVELGVCKGKKLHDKRDTLKERESRRDIERALRARSRD